MRIAISQPYFFPYLGYFKLIKSVDKFVFFDDVQYIRRGWVNRNKIRHDDSIWLTVPVKKSSRNSLINEILIDSDWSYLVDKHKKTFLNIYGKSVETNSFYDFYGELKKHTMLNKLLCESIIWLSRKMGIKTEFLHSSNFPSNNKREHRIIDICKQLNATEYYNLPGGVKLYSEDFFMQNSIKLKFIETSMYKKISIIETIFLNDFNSEEFCFS